MTDMHEGATPKRPKLHPIRMQKTPTHLNGAAELEKLCFSSPWSAASLELLTNEGIGVGYLLTVPAAPGSEPAVAAYGGMLITVDEGQIIIDGQDITHLSEHRRAFMLGRVFQDPMTGTAATMTIEENMALAYRRGKPRTLRSGITKEERAEYKKQLAILDLGLEDRLTSKVGLLSGGQRQALTLLMATLQKPKLLLLDEHTAALDPKTAQKVLDATDRIVEQNKLTTLMITHNMRDAIAHGNRLIMMYDGHIVVDVSGEEKKNLTVEQLLALFSKASGSDEADDKLLLS